MKGFGRGKGGSGAEAEPGDYAGKRKRAGGGRRRRLLSAVLLFGLFAVFTRPGRRLSRAVARRIDARMENFAEPGSATYARFFAPLLGRLYNRVAEEAARELTDRGLSRRAHVLDIGCGTGDLVVDLSRRLRDARIIGIDLSPSMLLYAGRHATTDGRLRFIVGDAATLPFDDASVDLVVSTLSLHHWSEPADGFAEIARVLRPGGVALIYDLGLLAYMPSEMARIAADAGLEPSDIEREGVGGGFVTRLFVRFKLEGFSEGQTAEEV
jgi:SAM-dependent methyltransferase